MRDDEREPWNRTTDPGIGDWLSGYGWSVWALPVLVAVILVVGALARWLGG